MKLSVKLFIGFSLIIILSIFDSYIDYKLSREVTKNAHFLTNSEAVIRYSTTLHKSIIEMQSGFRGYILTSNEHFLEPYYEGLMEIPHHFNSLDSLIDENPGQMAKLRFIKKLHNQWIQYADQIIVAKKEMDFSGKKSEKFQYLFENKMQKEVGKKMNDQIKTIFREFDRVEYKKREERRAVLTSSLRDSRYFSIGLSIFIMCISLMSAIYITHIISKRIKQMVNLANDIAQGHFKNISDHKNDELSQLSTSLNIMSNKLDKNFTELERKNEELDQFAYVVSHDLKAPLRGIYNIISWIEEDLQEQLTKELRKYFSLIKGRLSRLENLINGLLEFARIGREERKLEMVGVQLLLEEVIDLVVPPHYKVEIPDNLPVFYTERLRLQQVFSNLITNAVRHSGTENQKITIGYKEEDDFFCFWVQDFGKGIAPEFQHKIFQIFQTLREKDGLESTGLGLSIVKKIVEDQKGEIRLYSQPGKGAMFTFTWPKIPVKPFENAIG